MMGILLTITEDKVKLVSYLTTQHAIEDVFDFKNYVTEISHRHYISIKLVALKLKYSFIYPNMKNKFLKIQIITS